MDRCPKCKKLTLDYDAGRKVFWCSRVAECGYVIEAFDVTP